MQCETVACWNVSGVHAIAFGERKTGENGRQTSSSQKIKYCDNLRHRNHTCHTGNPSHSRSFKIVKSFHRTCHGHLTTVDTAGWLAIFAVYGQFANVPVCIAPAIFSLSLAGLAPGSGQPCGHSAGCLPTHSQTGRVIYFPASVLPEA
ncbi:hypothetical protein BaRGS_00013523 [Batillaria attramentaria]|uniref:Uncharacterized protein n=1 Tax=Batillaria attramentaria TaxID=370345 RepID=A0ABD0L719_9CAEN